MDNIKSEFPILSKGLIYLDNASTTQKPGVMIDALVNVYEKANANVHRGMYPLSQTSDSLWNESHEIISKYINATSEEVFFVRNATEGLNWLARTFEDQFFQKDDVVVISQSEHHSNILPWRRIVKTKGIVLEICQLNDKQEIDINHLNRLFEKYGSRIKLVSINHISNVLGTTNDIKHIATICRKYNSYIAVDGTQSIAHMLINVKDLDCDFYFFSGHKVYGPNGVGVVYAKKEILEKTEPVFQGGEMVDFVSDDIKYAKLPFKFEAGTPNIADGIALGQTLKWFSSIEGRFEFELGLAQYLYSQFSKMDFVDVLNKNVSSIISFNVKGVHHHDVAGDLGEMGICVRAGYHCAQPLHESLKLNGTVRASLGLYNTKEDIDSLCNALEKIYKRYNNE